MRPVTAQPVVSPVRRDRSTQILLLVAALVAVAGLAFAIGRLTAPAPAAAANRTFGNGAFGGFGGFGTGGQGGAFTGAGRGLGFGGGIQGTVVSDDGSTLQLKLANGSTVSVQLGSSTTYHSQVAADASSVKTGGTVIVRIQRTAGATPAPSGATPTLSASDVTVVNP